MHTLFILCCLISSAESTIKAAATTLTAFQIRWDFVAVVSTVGATACYGMSWACGKALVYALWPDKLSHFGAEVRKRQGSLISYIILLRVTPVLPNTFINVASPMVDIPLPPFMLGT